MKTIRLFFLSRRIVLLLFIALLLQMLVGGTVPQSFLTPADTLTAWRLVHPLISPIIVSLGLDHIFTSFLFTATLFSLALSLAFSTQVQWGKAWRKTFGPPLIFATTEDIKIKDHAAETLRNRLLAKGYKKTWNTCDTSRFIRYPWGHWGLLFFHMGLLFIIIASLCIFLTTRQGFFEFYEGQVVQRGEPAIDEIHGFLEKPFRLPAAMRVIEIKRQYWETGDLKQLTTKIEFVNPDGSLQQHRLAINQPIGYKGLKIYQTPSSGMAFFVDFIDDSGKVYSAILPIPRPGNSEAAGYRNFNFSLMQQELQTKYYPDASLKNIESDHPLLVLRLVSNHEVSINPGESARLGAYTLHLVDIKKWSGIVFTESTGITGVFFGFFLLILGSALHYFTPPREVCIIRKAIDQQQVHWKVDRFCEQYSEEFKELTFGLETNIPSSGS